MSRKINGFWIGLMFLLGIMSCVGKGIHGKEGSMTTKTIEEVLKDHTGELMSIHGVVGTAIGLCDERPCIKVYVTEKTPELERKIPGILEGYRVMMEESGEFRKLPQNR